MKHIVVSDFGDLLGLTSERLTIKNTLGESKEWPLRKIRSIQISKKGIAISSNLLSQCARYGIKVFIGEHHHDICCLYGANHHAVVKNRLNQYEFMKQDEERKRLACGFIYGKLRNQRATLLYFGKQKAAQDQAAAIQGVAYTLDQMANRVRELALSPKWEQYLLGIEGQAAHLYWQVLAQGDWLGDGFERRTGRHAEDVANKALNYGYAILANVLWGCVLNAGLEAYLGVLHTVRPGKPALVLDFMEEYRSWVVDRSIIKLRHKLDGNELTVGLRKRISEEILTTLEKPMQFKGKQIQLEHIMQRQCYRMSGLFAGEQQYRPMLFRW